MISAQISAAPRPRPAQVERTLQQEVTWRLKAYPVVAIPVPNGVWIPARTDAEKRLVARIMARMKADGLLLPGAPDLALLWAGGSGVIELKRPGWRDSRGYHAAGQPSDDQIEFAALCKRRGVHHGFARSWEQVRAHLVDWGAVKETA